jgi:hypothetical protein
MMEAILSIRKVKTTTAKTILSRTAMTGFSWRRISKNIVVRRANPII